MVNMLTLINLSVDFFPQSDRTLPQPAYFWWLMALLLRVRILRVCVCVLIYLCCTQIRHRYGLDHICLFPCLWICFSEIYCTGPILDQVQKAKLFDDDKHFVDMKLKKSPGKSKLSNLSPSFFFFFFKLPACDSFHPVLPLHTPMSFPADVVLSAFRELTHESPNTTVPRDKLQEFLSMYFEKPETEFESWTPPDWHDGWVPEKRKIFLCLKLNLVDVRQLVCPGQSSLKE